MVGLTSLPPEVMRGSVQLAIELDADSAGKYTTVSREQQAYPEEKIFSPFKIRLTQIEELRDNLTPLRQSYVRNVDFEVILPEYDVELVAETPGEQHHNSQSFTGAILGLLDSLAGWRHHIGRELYQRPGISLTILASSPSDRIAPQLGTIRYRRKR
jgi:hypothetical protein